MVISFASLNKIRFPSLSTKYGNVCSCLRLTVIAGCVVLTNGLISTAYSTPSRVQSKRIKLNNPTAHKTTSTSSFSLPWNATTQGDFITSMSGDRQGRYWIGTEGKGVWRFDRSAPFGHEWTQFDSKSGFGDDNCYALTCDRLGRIWAGTLNHGVSVFNGKNWKTYGPLDGPLDGPLGSRIFAITTSPKDGDIWMSTEAGLSRYSLAGNSWIYYTRADGLPSDQSQAVAFDHQGNLFVGTDCDGIAIGLAADNFKVWRVVSGPETPPNAGQGEGLPSSLINALLVAHDGTVYAGTTTGLATSQDDGKTWQFRRGADWRDKLAGMYPPTAPTLKQSSSKPLLQDYVTSLAEDSKGQVWVGHRTKGYEIFLNNGSRAVPYSKDAIASDFVNALLPLSSGHVLIGKYGGGLTWAEASTGNQQTLSVLKKKSVWHGKTLDARGLSIGQLPVPAKPPTLSEMNTMLSQLSHVPTEHSQKFEIQVLADDWITQGTWVDNYGSFASILCAMNGGGNDQVRGYRAEWVDHRAWIGRNGGAGDYLRYWVQGIHTDDVRSLQNMLKGGRKEAEWDDHGEDKSTALDGPHVYGTFTIPKGHYVLSCYDFNKDGHDGENRLRDYLVQVRYTPMSVSTFLVLGLPGKDAEAAFNQAVPAAQSRIRNFWGGVWKRFYINVPADGTVTVRINRNYSHNTILCGVFIDPLGELCGPQGPVLEPATPRQTKYKEYSASRSGDLSAPLKLMNQLLEMRETNPEWYALHSRRYLTPLIRVLLSNNAKKPVMDIIKRKVTDDPRPDLSSCLNDVQLFKTRDSVFFTDTHYGTWSWEVKTEFGEKYNWDYPSYRDMSQWDDDKYWKFVHDRQKSQNLQK